MKVIIVVSTDEPDKGGLIWRKTRGRYEVEMPKDANPSEFLRTWSPA